MALELRFIHLMLHCNLMAMTQALSLDVSLAVYPPSFSNSSNPTDDTCRSSGLRYRKRLIHLAVEPAYHAQYYVARPFCTKLLITPDLL